MLELVLRLLHVDEALTFDPSNPRSTGKRRRRDPRSDVRKRKKMKKVKTTKNIGMCRVLF